MSALQEIFQRFADQFCHGYSPLYERLSHGVARDREMLELAGHAQRGQPAPNILLGAVHYLLLEDPSHPLARYFPSVGGTREPDEEAWTLFREFCESRRDDMLPLMASKRVQTNEVRRCTTLLPALHVAHTQVDPERPMFLVEVGASAGLNLLIDKWAYAYSRGARIGTSTLTLECEERGPHDLPLPAASPRIGGRLGIDIHPVDITDESQTRWLQALIWPELLDRFTRLRAALDIARQDPPPVVAGDALDTLTEHVATVPEDCVPVVFHSYVACQMGREGRTRLAKQLADSTRRIAYVSMEQGKEDPWPVIRAGVVGNGVADAPRVGYCHFHGEWIHWERELS